MKFLRVLFALLLYCLAAQAMGMERSELGRHLLVPAINDARAERLGLYSGLPQLERKPQVRMEWILEAAPDEPPEKFYRHAVNYGCHSRHDTGNKPNMFNQNNTCVGYMLFGEEKVFGIRPFITVRRVLENSREGKMDIVGVGGEACPAPDSRITVCFGAAIVRVRYEDAWKSRTIYATGIIPHFALEHGRHAIVIEILGENVYAISIRTKF